MNDKTKPETEQITDTTLPATKTQISVGDAGVQLRDLNDLWRFATMAFKANLVPSTCKSVEAAALIVQFGMELGLSPMVSLQNIYIVGNKPATYGPIGKALAQASGELMHYREYFKGDFPKDDFTAVCEIARRGDKELTIKEFTVDDAKKAGLWGANNWVKYPKDMLMYKAVWRALYARFADRLKGIVPGEFANEYVDATAETIKSEPITETQGKSKAERLAEKLEARKPEPETKTEEPVGTPLF